MTQIVDGKVPRSYKDQVSKSVNVAVVRMREAGSTRHEALVRLEAVLEDVLSVLNGVHITSVSHLRRQLADVRMKLTAEYDGKRSEVSGGDER
jgi:hypothetical protein